MRGRSVTENETEGGEGEREGLNNRRERWDRNCSDY
jgi:hypothetical protein